MIYDNHISQLEENIRILQARSTTLEEEQGKVVPFDDSLLLGLASRISTRATQTYGEASLNAIQIGKLRSRFDPIFIPWFMRKLRSIGLPWNKEDPFVFKSGDASAYFNVTPSATISSRTGAYKSTYLLDVTYNSWYSGSSWPTTARFVYLYGNRSPSGTTIQLSIFSHLSKDSNEDIINIQYFENESLSTSQYVPVAWMEQRAWNPSTGEGSGIFDVTYLRNFGRQVQPRNIGGTNGVSYLYEPVSLQYASHSSGAPGSAYVRATLQIGYIYLWWTTSPYLLYGAGTSVNRDVYLNSLEDGVAYIKFQQQLNFYVYPGDYSVFSSQIGEIESDSDFTTNWATYKLNPKTQIKMVGKYSAKLWYEETVSGLQDGAMQVAQYVPQKPIHYSRGHSFR